MCKSNMFKCDTKPLSSDLPTPLIFYGNKIDSNPNMKWFRYKNMLVCRSCLTSKTHQCECCNKEIPIRDLRQLVIVTMK